MRALVVYCHPNPASFTAAVRDVVVEKLRGVGAEIRVRDLYGEGFAPVLTKAEHVGYLECPANVEPVADHVDDIRWCDTLIFVYPTWWYGLPAMIKGWLDRVLLPDVAFSMPKAEGETIGSAMTHITRLGVFTTCGASRWLTALVGAPGRRTLTRGVGFLCSKRAKRVFAAHYLMDSSTPESRAAHLKVVAAKMDKLVGRKPVQAPAKERAAA
ncbi:MAG: NAD(P)H-dependent oxidoreductase [Pseudomonadota bacterium]